MNRHDTTYSDACRIARAAVRARLAGDEQTARRLESKALSMVEGLPVRRVTEWGRKLTRVATAAIAVLALSLPGVASAQEKPRKPSVCSVYELVSTKAGKAALCLDGKRPRVFTSFSEGTLTDPATGAVVRFLVGF